MFGLCLCTHLCLLFKFVGYSDRGHEMHGHLHNVEGTREVYI